MDKTNTYAYDVLWTITRSFSKNIVVAYSKEKSSTYIEVHPKTQSR